ncbi:hypothetical protein Tco_0801782 [Tanacetum coccineum]|uniref:Uncharacterized protein n=1 Tax=Tanacetum coccineum TaxID=301880 RepID=A0ABQ4ZWX8_9ASTR
MLIISSSQWVGEEPHHNKRPTLQRLPFYCIVVATPGSVILGPILDELAATVLDTKVLAKAEKSKKRKSSNSGTASSQVAKRTMSTMAHVVVGSAQKSLFDGLSDDEVHDVDEQDDGQDDDCVEITLITPIMSDVKLPFGGARAKDIMGDRVDTPSKYVGRPQDFVGVDPSNVDPSNVGPTIGGDIERDLYPSILGHNYVDYPKEGLEVFKYHNVCKAVVDQFPALVVVLWVETLSDEQLTHKLSVLHCVMMFHGGELLVRLWGLSKAHDEYKSSSESNLKGLNQQLSSINGLNSQIYDLKEQFIVEAAQLASDLTDARRAEARKRQGMVQKFLGSDEFSRVRGEIISLALNVRLIEATPLVVTAEYPYPSKVVDHSNDPLSSLISLEPDRLSHLVPASAPRAVVVPPSYNESTITPASPLNELASKDAPSSVVVALTAEKEGEYAPSVSQHVVVVSNDSPAIFQNDHTLREV